MKTTTLIFIIIIIIAILLIDGGNDPRGFTWELFKQLSWPDALVTANQQKFEIFLKKAWQDYAFIVNYL